ncbi:MAG TPA: right-handed parallel beta-helix repeat-containing protein [Candidatus Limnocylindrales bacterium]
MALSNAFERYANNAQSVLSAGIGSGDGTLAVASAATFPLAGRFRVQIDSEILLVTSVSGTTFTVARAREGTSAASHSAGAGVTLKVTAASLLGAAGPISVLAYGAVGDGTTEDTTALNAARDAAGTNGTVYLPDGTYLVGQINLNVAGQRWHLSAGAILKAKPAMNTDVVKFSAVDVTLEGGTIDQDKANQSSGAAVWINASRATIRGSTIVNGKNGLVNITSCDRARLLDCAFKDSGSQGVFGENNCTNALVDRCSFTGMTGTAIAFHSTTSGQSVDGTRVTNNYIEGAVGFCIEIGPFGGNRPRGVVVANNECAGAAAFYGGISLDNCDGAVVVGNTYDDHGYAADISGIELAGANECAVTGNVVRASKTTGCAISIDRASRNTVSGNVIHGWDYAGNSIGIHISTSQASQVADDNSVTGNTFIADASNSRYAIWVQSNATGGSCNRNVIANNVFIGTGSATAIKLEVDTGAVASTIILGNSFTGWSTKVDVDSATGTIQEHNN